MSRPIKSVLLSGAGLAVIAGATSAVLITRASIGSSPPTQVAAAKRGTGNRFLQPEALRVSRRLGKRFTSANRMVSVMAASVNIAGSEQRVMLTRRQEEGGEMVELALPGGVLTWNATDGATAASRAATEQERLLLERLICDSPDNFVLAQLRGASYYTVARNVRPPNANDDYSGPLWTIVRVDEPRVDETLRASHATRLYYLNSQTGLIDRVVSQGGDETVEAEISAWTDIAGEKIPARITWSSAGRGIMSYQLNSFSHSE